ncbi:MAG TPA: hypothetical protein VFO35_21935 [Steroidobacteraceae bacterium]|nr:hypothetical protein [Steroidobacteraceae bacterium]
MTTGVGSKDLLDGIVLQPRSSALERLCRRRKMKLLRDVLNLDRCATPELEDIFVADSVQLKRVDVLQPKREHEEAVLAIPDTDVAAKVRQVFREFLDMCVSGAHAI